MATPSPRAERGTRAAGRPIALVVAACVAFVAIACGGDAEAATTIAIRYSRFEPEKISARAGEPITITLRNDDPIDHEWMVGDAAMHERHRTGTEPFHDEVSTEVTVPALSSRVTTVTFDEPGEYRYICHLPGHEAYGMSGVLVVSEAGD